MPALNSIVSEMVKAGVLNPARWYLYFDRALTFYGGSYDVSDGFEVKLKFCTTVKDDDQLLFGDNYTVDYYCRLSANGELRVWVAGAIKAWSIGDYNDAKIHSVHLIVTPTSIELIYDGVSKGVLGTGSASKLVFTIAYSNTNSKRFYGYLFDVELVGKSHFSLSEGAGSSVYDSIGKVSHDLANYQDGLWQRRLYA